MAHVGSKGWYVAELKKMGVTKHPIDNRKLESHKGHVLQNLFFTMKEKK